MRPGAELVGTGLARPLLVLNPHARRNRPGVHERVERILKLLGQNGIYPDVCLEADLQQVRQSVATAVSTGSPLVIAAGGDGTIEAVAPTLVHSSTALGILPLGTYNNLAASLNIPSGLEAACGLLGSSVARSIDVGEVRSHGSPRAQVFLEQGSIGLAPLLAPMGEGLEKGHWLDALRALPAALRLEPVPMRLQLDGEVLSAETLLVTVCNAPRSAAALMLAPEARLDDGQLDVCVYAGLHQAQLASMLFEFISGGVTDHPGVWRKRVSSLEISSTTHHRLLVAADAEVVGETPARFQVVPAALRVITPHP